MARASRCQTPGAVFHTEITPDSVRVEVVPPFGLELTEAQAAALEVSIHNALELALAPLFAQRSVTETVRAAGFEPRGSW